MRKRKGDQPSSQPPNAADEGTDKAAIEPGQGETPAEAAKIDSPALVPPQSEPAASEPITQAPADAPKLAPPAQQHAPAAARLDEVRPGGAAAPRPGAPAAALTAIRTKRWPLPLAASIAIAAAFGALAGSFATAGLSWRSTSEPTVKSASADDLRALKESIVRTNTEMVALKAAIDTSGRTANAQFAKVGERLDRFERAQAEPSAKLAKITEAIERLERRAPAATTTAAVTPPATPLAASDTTATVATLVPPPATEPARPAGPPIVDGWVLRSVYNGAALVQGRYGVIEVEPGDQVPGLGRVENIRRQDGRWVVVTSKGLIVTR